jgi:hypothetical protein
MNPGIGNLGAVRLLSVEDPTTWLQSNNGGSMDGWCQGLLARFRLSPLLLCAALVACNSPGADKLRAANAEIERLRYRLESLEKWRLTLPNATSGHLALADEGYTVVETDLGRLSFQLKSAKPEGNGSRIDLRVGNPMSATITKLKMRVDYGPNDTNGLPDYSSSKSIERNISTPIISSSWNTISILLPDTPPNRLGYIDISGLTAETITLYETK